LKGSDNEARWRQSRLPPRSPGDVCSRSRNIQCKSL
jgi:hypothetical protein